MGTVRVALAAGLTLLALAIGLTLLRAPMVVARKNGIPLKEERIGEIGKGGAYSYCQAGELLPKGTSAIRLALGANTGPSVTVRVDAAGRALTSGTGSSGWTGRVVTVPLKPLPRAVPGTTICASFRLKYERMIVFGAATRPAIAAHDGADALSGRIWIEYLRPGSSSWASLVPSVARRMGLGRSPAGTWNALVALELLAAVVIAASALLLVELR
ncbi:MAG TPA: hypothetical protein VK790_06855 [Solirubrobacteraceae bacterium]|jgi:hypothetical protein|nr:hypothetical protein [Solirubrobacteraceae bacterium]